MFVVYFDQVEMNRVVVLKTVFIVFYGVNSIILHTIRDYSLYHLFYKQSIFPTKALAKNTGII